MKAEIFPHQQTLGIAGRIAGGKKGRKILNSVLSRSNIILLPLSFLLGRGRLAGELMPFGAAIYAATLGLELNRIPIIIAVLLGMATVGGGGRIYAAGAGMLLFNAFNMPFKSNGAGQNFRLAAIAFISILIPELTLAFLQGFLLYDILKALLNAFLMFLPVFVFRNAVPAALSGNSRILSSEEVISVAITVALAVAGLGELKVFGLDLRNTVSVAMIIFFGYGCGPGVGAAVGVTAGIIAGLSAGATPLLIGSYAFCGLLAGLFKKLGKIGSGLGFVMGNAMLTLCVNGSTEVLIHLKEILLSIGVFMLFPGKFAEKMAVALNIGNGAADAGRPGKCYIFRTRDMMVDRLNRFSKVFSGLSKTFGEMSLAKNTADKHDISPMLDRVADRVCRDCSLCPHCWDRNFYSTYQALFKIVERLDLRGKIEESDIPGYFVERCERINDFVAAINNAYEVFKVDMVWRSRIVESRGLISQQLEGVSRAISSLADEIGKDMDFKESIEESVERELDRAGVKIIEAVVLENRRGKYEIGVLHKGCGGKRICAGVMEKAISSAAGRKMSRENSDCRMKPGDKQCLLRFAEEEMFRVTAGIAKVTRHDAPVSGDSHTFLNNGIGKFIIALSDGMGSGQRAAMQSGATINMIEQFMESGFDKDITVKIINSLLVLKSGDDSFSTIDMSIVDLYDGEVEFVKVGAAPTFVKRNGRVETVRLVALPAGIMSGIEVELAAKKLDNGDMVIMMTDGVLDAFENGEGNADKAMAGFLEEIDSANPQHIADAILDKAYAACRRKPGDDMTVLAAKVWKRPG